MGFIAPVRDFGIVWKLSLNRDWEKVFQREKEDFLV